MRRLILIAVLLFSACWLVAQSDPSQTKSSSGAGAGSETTVQGCLGGSEGNYTLTDKSGTSYQLAGDTAKLKEHVGHEVKVTGTASAASAASSQSGSGMGQAGSSQAIQVTSVKMVSKSCPSGGGAH